MSNESSSTPLKGINFKTLKAQVIEDFRLVSISRETSLLGRREVLTGKAKFGIFGDGKELAQIALAKQFRNGDFRSGYYRDQTLMMAIGQLNTQQYFAGLYAHTDVEQEPQSAGRQMGGHFATRNLDSDGNWKNLMEQKNSSADISPTAGQMPRLLGLALASKIYREHPELKKLDAFNAAPPINPPSISGQLNNSCAFVGFTLPPYKIEMLSATISPYCLAIVFLMKLCTS